MYNINCVWRNGAMYSVFGQYVSVEISGSDNDFCATVAVWGRDFAASHVFDLGPVISMRRDAIASASGIIGADVWGMVWETVDLLAI